MVVMVVVDGYVVVDGNVVVGRATTDVAEGEMAPVVLVDGRFVAGVPVAAVRSSSTAAAGRLRPRKAAAELSGSASASVTDRSGPDGMRSPSDVISSA